MNRPAHSIRPRLNGRRRCCGAISPLEPSSYWSLMIRLRRRAWEPGRASAPRPARDVGKPRPMTPIQLSPLDLALAASLLVVEAGLSLLLGLRLHRQVLVAS